MKGEPAFPVTFSSMADCKGLSKRELFAAFALQGILRGENTISKDSAKEASKEAILCADALIKELEK